jgi:hypothetical protein
VTGVVSALYTGSVSHRRFSPKPHKLRYAMFQLLLDLDEASLLARRLHLFSVNRFNLFSHHDRDHGEGRPGALRAWVDETLADAGMPIRGGRVLLLCMPRMLGHVFNPLSIYYCYRPGGELMAMIYEVNNTFGQRHCYVIEVNDTDGVIRHSCPKALHVSPFMDMTMTYDFELSEPGQTIRTAVSGRDAHGDLIIATAFAGVRRELTEGALIRALFGYPLLTLKVVAAIHLEAARLWFKGLELRPSPPPPEPVTVVTARRP